MSTATQIEGPALKPSLESGPFVLRTLLQDVPLSADGGDEVVEINCVDFLDSNLYVGTSASELLHFVQIPPDPSDKTGRPTFILASRLRPTYFESTTTTPGAPLPGVQQILLLPWVGKACVLCNSTVTFYSLPELSPVFDTTHVKNCTWIGGIDLNEAGSEARGGSGDGHPYQQAAQHRGAPSAVPGVTILLSLNKRIQVVRIGWEEARGYKKIDFAGSTLSVRRDNIACVADSRTYALVDVDRQLKIPLMSISSLDSAQSPSDVLGQVQSIAGGAEAGGALSRSSSNAQPRVGPPHAEAPGHTRSTSLGVSMAGGVNRKKTGDGDHAAAKDKDATAPARSPSRSPGPQSEAVQNPPATDKPLPPIQPEAGASALVPITTLPTPVLLKPLIVSPTPDEFLLVTGTSPSEPGIGMFVNLDGDPTRPTLEFETYPNEIVVDGGSTDLSSSVPSPEGEEEGYVLASMSKEFPDGVHHGLEIQRWDVNVGEDEPTKFWLEVKASHPTCAPSGHRPADADASEEARDTQLQATQTLSLGMRSLVGAENSFFSEVVERLCQRRFAPFVGTNSPTGMSLRSLDSRTALSMEQMSKERDLFERDLDSPEEDPLPEGWEAERNAEEEAAALRLAQTTSRLAVWAGDQIWWAMRNPLLLQLEAGLEANRLDDAAAAAAGPGSSLSQHTAKDRRQLFAVLNSFRGREPRTELEFRTFSYIRQRAGVLLFASLLLHPSETPFSEPELRALEEVLLEGGLDPRVVLALTPGLRHEIVEGRRGIWIPGGVKATVERHLAGGGLAQQAGQTVGVLDHRILQFLRRFLTACRRRKGFGSVPDEHEVSRTVDASLLAVLLELDRGSGVAGGGGSSAVRGEINELVDRGVDCLDRAVDLLESYSRLFVLSRLYQSRKMSTKVLATWRRIIEGEADDGGEFGAPHEGELRVREYLSKVGSQALVQEYGLWLASRNPRLGVQVFADDKGRAAKFAPQQVVQLLREEAPDAVKYYLEHLVFDKGHTVYVGELVSYYLDVVMTDLESSPGKREDVAAMYGAYRALRPPKPTFRRFLTDNAPPEDEVWRSRLRLLQLLGGVHDYDVAAIRERISRGSRGRGGGRGGAQEEEGEELLVPETIILDGREGRHANALRLLVHRLGDYDTAVLYCLRQGEDDQDEDHPKPSSRADKKQPPKTAKPTTTTTTTTKRALFRSLLGEFLSLADVSDRVEQTGRLLERFGGFFDALEVLGLIPDGWVVDASLAGFLVSALRRLVRERHECMVARALSGAENLRVNYDLVRRIEEKGPTVEAEG